MCKQTRQIISLGVICLLLVGLGGIAERAMAADDDASAADGYTLDLAQRAAIKTIGADVANAPAMKFVQIEVAQVINPAKLPLSFNVYYQPAQGDKILLGTFSLFPPDNPGTFIVATNGNLQNGGVVIVSLTPLQKIDEKAELRVQIKRIAFVAG